MKRYNEPSHAIFDIGFGPTWPDREILEEGRGPADIYFSPEQFEAEKDVFGKIWLQVARKEEVANPGDWVVREVEIRDASIIIVRDKKQGIRAFHNVCPHRGMRLVQQEKGHSARFTCPFHSWSYANDGKLKVLPDEAEFPQVCKDDIHLTPVHIDEWAGFLFVNLDRHPTQTLNEFLGPLAGMLKDAPFEEFTCFAEMTETVSANWKLGVDSGAEGYHVPSLHAKSAKWAVAEKNPHFHFLGWEPVGPHRISPFPLNPDFRLGPNKPIQHFAYSHTPQHMISGTGEESGQAGIGFGNHPDLNRSKAENWGGDMIFLFPVGALNLTYNSFYHNSYWPLTSGTSRWVARCYFHAPHSRREQFAMECSMAQNRDVLTEDNFSVRSQYAGLKSGAIEHVYFGGTEMLPRHLAAVVKGIADARPGWGKTSRS